MEAHKIINFIILLDNKDGKNDSGCLSSLISLLQDVMFQEIRRPRGDPKVLAVQSREQYYKVTYRCSGKITFGYFLCSSIRYFQPLTFPFIMLTVFCLCS